MFAFLWGCLIIFFKGLIGSLVFIAFALITGLIFGGLAMAIGHAFSSPPKPPEKKPETWQEWTEKQDGELKSLLTEIDKDLENETKS